MKEITLKHGLLIICMVIAVIANIIVDGFIISKLWEWLVVSSFGFVSISIAQAIALVLIIFVVRISDKKILDKAVEDKDKNNEVVYSDVKNRSLLIIAKLITFLPAGYILTLFI